MKHKVSDLEGALLDAAVAKAGVGISWMGDKPPPASTLWHVGGPIIERERIALHPKADGWSALVDFDGEVCKLQCRGPTFLIAAMRAYVASKFGDEVDL